MRIEKYVVEKKNDALNITRNDDIICGEKICDMPRHKYVECNRAHAWDEPGLDQELHNWFKKFEDGQYIAEFEYQYYNCGWAAGPRWYGKSFYKKS